MGRSAPFCSRPPDARPWFDADLAAAPVYAAGTSLEEAALRTGRADLVKLASNESPLGPSPRAVQAIRRALSHLHRYPPVSDDALRARLARYLGGEFHPDQFVTANGGTEVLALIAQAFLARGDEAVICPPTFPLYEIFARRRGARPVRCALRPADWSYDVGRILRAITPATRVVHLCSPVNPTGTVLTRRQADRLMAALPRRILVVFDESYRDFVDDPDAADSLAYIRAGRCAVSVRSFSKSHGLAGLRVGYALAPADLAAYVRRARNPFHLGAPAVAGALAALDDARHLARTRRVVRTERARLFRALARRDLSPVPSQANFILFFPGVPPETLYERLLARGVIVRPAANFYVPDGVRVSVGSRADNERFLSALDEVL